jgi:hypothetical protein
VGKTTITVSLPPLAPGEQPPKVCPACGSDCLEGNWTPSLAEYMCGATAGFTVNNPCQYPSAPAVVVAAMVARGDSPADIIGAVAAAMPDDEHYKHTLRSIAVAMWSTDEMNAADALEQEAGE